MDRNNGASPVCYARRYTGGINIPVRAHIRENRSRSSMQDDVHGCAEGQWSCNHLRSGSDIERYKRQVQGCRRRIDPERVICAYIRRELFFELSRTRPRGEPAGLQSLDHFFDFFRSDARTVKRNFHKFLSYLYS